MRHASRLRAARRLRQPVRAAAVRCAAQYGQPGSPFNAYGQPAYYGVPPEPKGLSIASLCCGIAAFVGLGFFLLPQLAAVILGHLALRREPAGRGMAIAGLVMGYVGIALTLLVFVIIAVGLAMGGSSVRRVRGLGSAGGVRAATSAARRTRPAGPDCGWCGRRMVPPTRTTPSVTSPAGMSSTSDASPAAGT